MQPSWPSRPKMNFKLLFYFLKLYKFCFYEIFVASTDFELCRPKKSRQTQQKKSNFRAQFWTAFSWKILIKFHTLRWEIAWIWNFLLNKNFVCWLQGHQRWGYSYLYTCKLTVNTFQAGRTVNMCETRECFDVSWSCFMQTTFVRFPQRKHSTKQHVLLTNLTLDSGGTYKCEVSAEAPSFRTKSAHQDMVVVVLPSKAEIMGVHPKYQVGDIVNVTCFSYRYAWRVLRFPKRVLSHRRRRWRRRAGPSNPSSCKWHESHWQQTVDRILLLGGGALHSLLLYHR